MKAFILMLPAVLFSIIVFSQGITGNWEGKLETQGSKIPIIFHISKDSANQYIATFDSPDQKAFNQ